MGEVAYRGVGAAPGLALGRARDLDRLVGLGAMRPATTPERERALLRQALDAARDAIERLASGSDADATDMLAVQSALLDDDAFIAPVLAAIGRGGSAAAAWHTVVTQEAAEYAASMDGTFAAKAADLADVRDRVLALLSPGTARTVPDLPGSVVLVGLDLPLSQFLETDWSRGGGILLRGGSAMGHVAVLARGRGIPMVVRVENLPSGLDGREILVDGIGGTVTLDPGLRHRRRLPRGTAANPPPPARRAGNSPDDVATADGTRIDVTVSINELGDLDRVDPTRCGGIGLVRTEVLFHREAGLPSEDEQCAVYRRLLSWAGGRPVTVRTFDFGGDKPLPGSAWHDPDAGLLGLRGLRLSLRDPVILKHQFRALARAARYGDLRVLLPMVTLPEELDAARSVLDTAMAGLAPSLAARPPLGIMVEVPAAAITINSFSRADFFSIGSNDLAQYAMAAGRHVSAVSRLADPLSPAVLQLVGAVVLEARRSGRMVHLCGDAASDPRCIGAMLGAGVRSLCVEISAFDQVLDAIAATRLEDTGPAGGPAHG